jgi:protein gp37
MTKIEWCDLTINPVVGCSHCSEGCRNCYAERFAARLAKNPKTAAKYAGVVDEHGKWTGMLSPFDLRKR